MENSEHFKGIKKRGDKRANKKSNSRKLIESTLKHRYSEYLSTLFDDEVEELVKGTELILYVHGG